MLFLLLLVFIADQILELIRHLFEERHLSVASPENVGTKRV